MDRQEAGTGGLHDQPISRRSLIKGIGAGSLAFGATGLTGSLLSACGSGIKGAGSGGKAITIGWILSLIHI